MYQRAGWKWLLLSEQKAVVFEGWLVGSGWGTSHWGCFLQGRRRLRAAEEGPELPITLMSPEAGLRPG